MAAAHEAYATLVLMAMRENAKASAACSVRWPRSRRNKPAQEQTVSECQCFDAWRKFIRCEPDAVRGLDGG